MSATPVRSPALNTPLSPSPHVDLLEAHYRQRSRSLSIGASSHALAAAASAAASNATSPLLVDVFSPPTGNTPILRALKSPVNSTATTATTSPATTSPASPSSPSSPLPLPPGWAAERARILTLPSEKRELSTLHIDTSDTRALRRGLYIATACMCFPDALGLSESLAAGPKPAELRTEFTIEAPATSNDETAPVPPISLSLSPLESILDIRVPSNFCVDVVTGGITNRLYKCSLSSAPDKTAVLVRIFGPRTELVIDRSKENDVVDVLSACGAGPKIYGRFANGRLESWLIGASMTPEQMREPHLSGRIAEALAVLHVQDMPFPREAVIASVLEKWSALAGEVAFPEAPEKQRMLDALDLPTILAATKEFLLTSNASYYGSHSQVVFAHNDLLSGNLMLDTDRDSIALVDFEYGNFNPRGFDLANHFCECCGFDCDWTVFPSTTAQLHFIRHYLAAINGTTPDAVSRSECHALYAEVQCWLPAPHLFWSLWAVVQSRYSPIAFDYLAYAHQRWQGFQRMKAHCDAWAAKTKEEVDAIETLE